MFQFGVFDPLFPSDVRLIAPPLDESRRAWAIERCREANELAFADEGSSHCLGLFDVAPEPVAGAAPRIHHATQQ